MNHSLRSITHRTLAIATLSLLWLQQALAQDATGTEAITQVGTGIAQGLTLILNIVSAVVFVLIAWAIITKFNDARRGRSDWGEVVVPFIAGAVVIAFMGWLNTQGTAAIAAIGGGA